MDRFLILILFASVISGCTSFGSSMPASANMSVVNHVGNPYSISHGVARIIEETIHRMPEKASRLHYNTIQFLINNQPVGSVAEWYLDEENMHGIVRLETDLTGNQTCRLYSATVYWAHKQRTLTEWACTRNQGKTWNFYPKNS